MFARKHKPRDEEPLVPHGMIWQATEESMSPGNAEKPASQSPSTTKPIEMPRFWRNPTAPDPSVRRAPVSVRPTAESPKETPEKIEAKAAPPRPLAPVQELTKRRMLIQEERAEDKRAALKSASVRAYASPVAWPDQAPGSNAPAPPQPILISTPPRSEPTSPAQNRPTPAVQPIEAQAIETQPIETQPRLSETPAKREFWSRARGILAWFGRVERGIRTALVELARGCRATTVRGLSELGRRAKNIYDTRALAKRMRTATLLARKIGPVPTSNAGADSQPHIQPENATAPYAESAATSLMFHTHRSVKAFTSFARNLRNRRVRIRIVADAPALRITRAVAKIRALAGATARKNNRFLTPLLMAAVSAVLALGMIAAVRRYESRNHATLAMRTPLPAEGLAPTTFAATPSPSKPSATVEKPVSVQAGLRIPSKNKTNVTKPVIPATTSEKQIRRRPHHNADEDYVAKDTYVYYGKP